MNKLLTKYRFWKQIPFFSDTMRLTESHGLQSTFTRGFSRGDSAGRCMHRPMRFCSSSVRK